MGYDKKPKDEGSPMPNLNKGYGHESVKTERHNLMNDNPVAKDASGGRDGSWMSKHSQSRMGGGSPLAQLKGDQVKLDKNKNGKIDGEDFKMM
mgnify:FL=1|jgi:hypothetical protein|tara:strand:+ start:2966 stop:3244 length:279 start_codon:yes stop_codon:yes gene_type:complete